MNPITVFLTVACLAVGAGLGATGYLYSGVPFVIAAIIIAAALKMANLIEAEERKKHIVYSSRTRLNTDNFREKHALRQAIVELFEQLPPPLKQNEKPRKLRDLGDDHAVAVVHLIYRRASYEGQATDYEFSRASMDEHWQTGLDDGRRTLRRSAGKESAVCASSIWLRMPNLDDGRCNGDVNHESW